MATGENVLVIEDDPAISHMYQKILESCNFSVTTVASVSEAINCFRPGKYAVAIVDRRLPDRSGIEFVRVARQADPTLRFAIITAFASGKSVVDAFDLGVDVYLAKPLHKIVSLGRIVNLLCEKWRLIREQHSVESASPVGKADPGEMELALIDVDRRLNLITRQSKDMFAVEECKLEDPTDGAHAVPEWLLRATGRSSQESSEEDWDEEFLGRLFERTVEQSGAGSGSLMMVDMQSSELTIKHSKGLPQDVVREATVRIGEGVAGWVTERRQPLLIFGRLDLRRLEDKERPHFRHLVSRDRSGVPCSSMVIPFTMGGQDIAVLNLNRVEGQPSFQSADLDRIRIYIESLGTAMKYTLLSEQHRAHISDLSRVQSRLVHASRLSRLLKLGELASEVAHEINEPLNAIKLIVQDVGRDAERGRTDLEKLKADTNEINSIAKRIASIVDRVRGFDRRQIGDSRREVNVNVSIEEALAVISQQLKDREMQLLAELQPDLPPVRAAPNELVQVFTNFIANARDAVKRRHKKGRRIKVQSFHDPERNEVVVSVTDNGGGVPEEVREQIFEPFFTSKAADEGVGLGLSICHEIVSDHGGRIDLSVEKGEGSTFSVHMPAVLARRGADDGRTTDNRA